jgi:putative restriction endonuclease
MRGTIAITDYGWYDLLRNQQGLEEVNFWKPSATRGFHADQFSPFIFKLRAPHNAVCGFGFFARYCRLPVWLAWECFGIGNGCESLAEMRERIGRIRDRIGYKGAAAAEIGCVLIVQPVFFPRGCAQGRGRSSSRPGLVGQTTQSLVRPRRNPKRGWRPWLLDSVR